MARRRRFRGITDYFKRHTCNTRDDVTGLKVKLSDTSTRWDNIQTTKLNMEQRQSQDFPVIPRPQRVYFRARTEEPDPTPTPYDPASGWGDL